MDRMSLDETDMGSSLVVLGGSGTGSSLMLGGSGTGSSLVLGGSVFSSTPLSLLVFVLSVR